MTQNFPVQETSQKHHNNSLTIISFQIFPVYIHSNNFGYKKDTSFVQRSINHAPIKGNIYLPQSFKISRAAL